MIITELTNRASNNESERGEWKIQLVTQNNCISTKKFEDTRAIYSANKPVETSNDNGSEFTDESVALLYYNFQKIIFSHNWFRNKGATINPKNEKDNECFRWPITSGLN